MIALSAYPLLTSQVQRETQWPDSRLNVLIGGERNNRAVGKVTGYWIYLLRCGYVGIQIHGVLGFGNRLE